MATTNDAMFTSLTALYPTAGRTLTDLLAAHRAATGTAFSGLAEHQYYISQGAAGFTLADLANNFWSDPDFAVSNLELEDGTDLLLEDGSFLLLEVGNG